MGLLRGRVLRGCVSCCSEGGTFACVFECGRGACYKRPMDNVASSFWRLEIGVLYATCGYVASSFRRLEAGVGNGVV